MSKCLLRLYIAGDTMGSRRAQHNFERLQEAMQAQCATEGIDVLREPHRAEQAGIIATPTLCYETGSRARRVVGDLRETTRVLNFLGIEMKEGERDGG